MGLVMSKKIEKKVKEVKLEKKPGKLVEKALEPDPWEKKKKIK
jgi:hypothetical protein